MHSMRTMSTLSSRSIFSLQFGSLANSSPKLAAYGAAKAGLIHFTRTLAAEYADAGIRCVAIAPGPVHTGLVDKFTMAMIVRSVPLKRAALPAEIADFVRYIASNAVNLATGSVFTVDGGLSIRS